MSIAATDLIVRACANNGIEDDVSTAGGAIAATTGHANLLTGSDSPNNSLTIDSTNAGDTTQTVIIRAWKDVGTLQTSNTMTLNGTTLVTVTWPSGTGVVFRVVTVTVNAATVGQVEISKTGGPAGGIAVMDTNLAGALQELKLARMFIFASSPLSGSTIRYDKLFWKNTHATLTAITPTYRLTADPQAVIRQGIHTSINDTVTIANRVTTPGGITFVDDNIDQVGSDLAATDKQGVWWEMTAVAGAGPFASTFTTQITVNSI